MTDISGRKGRAAALGLAVVLAAACGMALTNSGVATAARGGAQEPPRPIQFGVSGDECHVEVIAEQLGQKFSQLQTIATVPNVLCRIF